MAVVTRLSAWHLDEGNPRLQRRLRDLQRTLAEGWDEWPLRFERARPDEETLSWRRADGELLETERTAHLPDPEALERFFADVGGAFYQPATLADPERAELGLYPATSGRATAGDRRHVERQLDGWCAAIAAHLAAIADLHAWLDEHPDRARPVFAGLFGSLGGETGDDGEGGEPEPAETALVARVESAMEEVAAVLTVPADEAFTLDELSRRVYDPFPARVSVSVPGEVLEVEGFVVGADGRLAIPSVGLWDALLALEGRWLVPDPLRPWVEAQRGDAEIDLDGWLARPRRSGAPPTAAEVREAIEAGLRPLPVYRVAWRPAAG